MFNDKFGLTQAVLEGRKTMTRRIISNNVLAKAKLFQVEYFNALFDVLDGKDSIEAYLVNYPEKLPYRVGEVVAISQCYRDILSEVFESDSNILSRGTYHHLSGWHNKMFVKASEMPHQICITDIRVERLQDISDEDCLREGIEFNHKSQSYYVDYRKQTGRMEWLGRTPREAFAELIDKVSGKGTWDKNPYVFVYEFTLVQ